MSFTTHRADAAAALTALFGLLPLHSAVATGEAGQSYSIVAQSTPATAATGRRPISQRIVASNLPVRAIPAPPPAPAVEDAGVAATEVSVPMSAGPVPAEVDADADAAVAAAAAVAAEPETDLESSLAAASDESSETEVAETVNDSPALPSEPAAVVELTGEVGGPEAAPEVPQTANVPTHVAATRPRSVAPAPSAEAHAESVPNGRGKLLGRIRTAIGMRPRSPHPAIETGGAVRSPQAQPAAIPATGAATSAHGNASPPAPQIIASAPAPAAIPAVSLEELAVGPTTPGAGQPARLEFDVRESRALVGEGEQIVMRIAVRNIGGDTAERVTATLFFAEGIEPVQAIGHAAEVYPGEVRFETVPELAPGSTVDLLVTAVGTRPGSIAYRGEIECREPAGRVTRDGMLTVRARPAAAP